MSAAIIAVWIQSREAFDVEKSVIRFTKPIFGASVARVCFEWGFVMMSANFFVVVTLSRVNRPCRTQCWSAKCLISTYLSRPGPKRFAMPMHADAFSFKRAVMCSPTALKNRKPTRAHTHKHLLNKTHFHRCSSLLVSASETNLPHTLFPASRDHQWLTSFSRPDQPMIRHTSHSSPSAARGAESVPGACLAFLEYNVRPS